MFVKQKKSVLSLVMILAIVAAMMLPTTAFAAVGADPSVQEQAADGVVQNSAPQPAPRALMNIYGKWTTVKFSFGGITGPTTTKMSNFGLQKRNDVQMLDGAGNVVWIQSGAIAANGQRTFYPPLGGRVTTIQVRVYGASNTVPSATANVT